jgi:NAD(P)-dependent dehydrogenase (short-subunit alcohol dehydrogenase family)
MRLNVLGTMAVVKAALPHLLSQEGGGVVAVVSSIAGKAGSPISATYSASKHALQGFVDSARMELAYRGVRFVSLCPGPVQGAPGGSAADEAAADSTRMPRERCADLMCAAVWAELKEAWIAPQPVLLFAYIAQFTPWLYFAIGPAIGRRRGEGRERALACARIADRGRPLIPQSPPQSPPSRRMVAGATALWAACSASRARRRRRGRRSECCTPSLRLAPPLSLAGRKRLGAGAHHVRHHEEGGGRVEHEERKEAKDVVIVG